MGTCSWRRSGCGGRLLLSKGVIIVEACRFPGVGRGRLHRRILHKNVWNYKSQWKEFVLNNSKYEHDGYSGVRLIIQDV